MRFKKWEYDPLKLQPVGYSEILFIFCNKIPYSEIMRIMKQYPKFKKYEVVDNIRNLRNYKDEINIFFYPGWEKKHDVEEVAETLRKLKWNEIEDNLSVKIKKVLKGV